MNHRSSGLLISDAIDGLLLAMLAEGRSPRTITGYRHDLRMWLDYASKLLLFDTKPVANQHLHDTRQIVERKDKVKIVMRTGDPSK